MAMGPSLVVGFLFLLFGVANANDCIFSIDGASYNLTGANMNSDLTAKDASGNNYFFRICQNTVTNCSCSGCTPTPACQKDNNNNLHSLGQLDDSSAFLSATDRNLQLQYLGGQKNRSVQFNLTCDPNAEETTVMGQVYEPTGEPIYYIRVSTKFACPLPPSGSGSGSGSGSETTPRTCDWSGKWRSVDGTIDPRFHFSSDGSVTLSMAVAGVEGIDGSSHCENEMQGVWQYFPTSSQIVIGWSTCSGTGFCALNECPNPQFQPGPYRWYIHANASDCSLTAEVPNPSTGQGTVSVPLKRQLPAWAIVVIALGGVVVLLGGVALLAYRRWRRSQRNIYEQA